MKSLKATLNVFVDRVTQSAGVSTTVIGIFLYHAVFDKDFECTCKDQTSLCWSYMLLPACIIVVLLLWMDGSFQAILKHTCLNCTTRFCCFLPAWIFRAILIGLLWPISVLMDGDWTVCCYAHMKQDCGKPISFDDQKKIKELKITSTIIGFIMLLIITFVAAILSPIPWRKCCCCCGSNEPEPNSESNQPKPNSESNQPKPNSESNQPKSKCKSECLSKDVLFKLILLEEGENLVKNKLIKVAEKKIDKKINTYEDSNEWGECFGVVEEIIKELSQKQNKNSTNTSPGGSSSAVGREGGSAVETQPMVQPPSPGSPSGSSTTDRSYGNAEERGESSGVGEERIPLNPSHESPSESSPNNLTT